jgi:hypothetical protein
MGSIVMYCLIERLCRAEKAASSHESDYTIRTSASSAVMNPTEARRSATIYTALFLVAFAFIFATMSPLISIYDEAIILTGAMRVANGEVPHRDFYANYGPAQFYIVALLFKLFGTSVMTERLWDVFIKAAIATLGFVALRAYCRPMMALAAYAACLIWLAVFAGSGFPLFPTVLFSLAATLLVAVSLHKEPHPVRIIAGGGCVGLVALFRYDIGGMVGTALMGVLIVAAISRRERFWRTPTSYPVLFAFAAAATFGVAALAYLLAGGSIGAFVHDVLHYSSYYITTRRLPFPSPDQIWKDPIALAVYVPPAVLAVALSLAASRNPADHSGWAIAAFASVCVAFYIKGWVRISVIHVAGAIIFALILLPIVWQRTPGMARRTLVVICAVLAGVPTLFALKAVVVRAENKALVSNFLLRGEAACNAPAHLQRVACVQTGAEWGEAVKFVIDNVAKDERLFAGVTRHEKIFINDILIYFAAERIPATRWHHYDPGLQTRADIQNDMVTELDQLVPRYIVLESAWDHVAEPNASAISSGVTILDDYIRLHYETVKQYGTISVLARK